MLQGKAQSALRYLCRQTSGGVLKLDDLIPATTSNEPVMQSTRDVLEEKHPLCKDPPVSSLLAGDLTPVNPIIFEGLDADMIKQTALHTNGAAGPSGLDAHTWMRLCSFFKSASTALCVALACVGRRLATSDVNPERVSVFVACHLIPLDKCPGVRPIGICEGCSWPSTAMCRSGWRL